MSFDPEKKSRIVCYLLEKLRGNDPSAVSKTAAAFEVTPATVYKYMNELLQNGVLRKVKRGQYELSTEVKQFDLKRSEGQLTSEHTVFQMLIKPELHALPQNAVDVWEYIFSEMFNNIIDHSAAENVRLVMIRDYLDTNLLLCDDGVGIFEKIKAYFQMDSVDDALRELFKGKLTTDSENHSGEGIFFSSRLADHFVIVSSDKLFSHDRFDAENLLQIFSLDKPMQGTCVLVSLSNRTKKKPSDIFDEYADPEDGFSFSKTSIPIGGYFESAPVSRSQAKRLTNRLSAFGEIELDFSGTEWMGQGFAHQLFVVFQRANPQIKLIPIHMNETVEKMYRHVLQP